MNPFPLRVCFFTSVFSLVQIAVPMCLCHVCYSCALLHLSLSYHCPGCTTVCVTWPILPVLTFLQPASERRMMGVPCRITWGLTMLTFLRGQNPQDEDVGPNIGTWESIWQMSGICCCNKGIAQMVLWFISTAKRCYKKTSIQRFPSQSHPLH